MKGIIFDTETEAETTSRVEAVRRGCQLPTESWWDIRAIKDGRFALIVNDDMTVIDENGMEITDPRVVEITQDMFPSVDDAGNEPGFFAKVGQSIKSVFGG